MPPATGAPEHRAQAATRELCMAATLAVTDAQATVTYRLASTCGHALHVHDVLTVYDADMNLLHDRFLAYVAFEGTDTLALKRVIPRPPLVDGGMLARYHMFRPLLPGGALEGTIVVELPAKESSPWYPQTRASVFRKAVAREVRVVLEYERAGEAGAAPEERRRIEVSFALATPVPVKRRSDMFEPVP